jgi:hypothetical protein
LRIDFAAGSRINVFLRVIGRLKPDVTPAAAQGQLDALAADLRKPFPIKQTVGVYLRMEPMHGDLVADVKPAIARQDGNHQEAGRHGGKRRWIARGPHGPDGRAAGGVT